MEEHPPNIFACSSSSTSLNFSPNPPCCSSSSICEWQFHCASFSSPADQADKWRLITSSSADDSSSGGVQEGKRPPIRTKTTMMTTAAMAGCAMPSACCSPQQQQKVRLKKCVEKSRSRRRKVNDDDELSCARLLVRPFLVRTLLGGRSGIGKGGKVGGNWARKGKGINNSRREERCCCSCGDCDRRGAAAESAAEAPNSSSVYHQNWQSLSQIVHLRARRATTNRDSGSSNSSFLSRESSMEEHDNDGEGKAGCRESFCGRKMKEWLFWLIVAFLAGLTIKDVVSLFKEYSANPKKSDMNVRFNETMAMPNITFCVSRAQAWSHFRLNGTTDSKEWEKAIGKQLRNMTDKESFLKQPWEFGLVMETYNLISTLTSMERETTAHGMVSAVDKFRTQDRLAEIRKLTKFWLNELQKRGVTFEEFMQKVGKETLRRSMQRFQRTSYDEDLVIKTQLTITWLSQMQLCFQPTFDQENFKPIDDQGQFFVMALSHNSETLDGQQVDCMSADFHGRPSSSSRFMGNKGTTKDGFTDELCIGMMHETTVELKARYKMLPNDEEGTACRDEDDGGDNEWDCHLRCRLDFIRSICNCTGPTLSHLAKSEEEMGKWPLCDYAQCKVDVQTGNYSDEECGKKCYRSCDQIRYNIDHERKGKSARPDFTTVVLKWGSFEYLTLEQDWVWSATTFIAAIGGSIGMWLGLSILSLIQGSTYLADYVTNNVIKKKRKQRQLSITDEPTQLPKASKASKIHPKLSKAFHDDQQHEDKLTANPFVSPFKKLSQVSPPPAGE